MEQLTRNLWWGLKWGIAFGVCYSLAGGLLLLVRSSGFLGHLGLTSSEFLGGYLLAGAVAGVVAGACRPLFRSRVGTALAGVLATFPAATLLMLLMTDEAHPLNWRRIFLTVTIYSVIAGPLLALRLREDEPE